MVRRVMEQLIKTGQMRRGQLGIVVQKLDPKMDIQRAGTVGSNAGLLLHCRGKLSLLSIC